MFRSVSYTNTANELTPSIFVNLFAAFYNSCKTNTIVAIEYVFFNPYVAFDTRGGRYTFISSITNSTFTMFGINSSNARDRCYIWLGLFEYPTGATTVKNYTIYDNKSIGLVDYSSSTNAQRYQHGIGYTIIRR